MGLNLSLSQPQKLINISSLFVAFLNLIEGEELYTGSKGLNVSKASALKITNLKEQTCLNGINQIYFNVKNNFYLLEVFIDERLHLREASQGGVVAH